MELEGSEVRGATMRPAKKDASFGSAGECFSVEWGDGRVSGMRWNSSQSVLPRHIRDGSIATQT